jgi:hypothetical protein
VTAGRIYVNNLERDFVEHLAVLHLSFKKVKDRLK